jgi:TatD DNase family protein
MKFVDIHTHSHYRKDNVIVVQNVFPSQEEELEEGKLVSVGLHPWHVHRSTMDRDIRWVEAQATAKNVLAVGEIGLDKTIACPWKDQVEAFERQLSVASSEEKPVILHCVRSYNEMLAYRKRSGTAMPWIFHWFNAGIEMARDLVGKNCYLSFGHMLFNEKSKAYTTFRQLPLERVFFETDDAGYSIVEVYEQAARIRGLNLDDLKKRIVHNFTFCFGR